MTKVAILGTGRMGGLIAQLAPHSGCELTAHLGRTQTAAGLTQASLNGAQVVIEFTVPTEAARLARACAELGMPVVSGTTGWEAERPTVEAAVRVEGLKRVAESVGGLYGALRAKV